jgi:hypothetical protein
MFPVPSVTVEENTIKRFYRYFLTQNVPLHIKDGAKDWPALQKWTDIEYIRKEFGGRKMKATVMTSSVRDKLLGTSLDYDKFVFEARKTQTSHEFMTIDQFLKDRALFKDKVIQGNTLTQDPEDPQK